VPGGAVDEQALEHAEAADAAGGDEAPAVAPAEEAEATEADASGDAK
jgi:hypothetical protein